MAFVARRAELFEAFAVLHSDKGGVRFYEEGDAPAAIAASIVWTRVFIR